MVPPKVGRAQQAGFVAVAVLVLVLRGLFAK
jgi:hypothetical protein